MFKVSWSLFGEFSEILQISLNSSCHGQYQTTPQLMNIVERVRYKSTEKVPGPAVIQTQDLLNTSQTLLPLNLDPWAEERKTSFIGSISQRSQRNFN